MKYRILALLMGLMMVVAARPAEADPKMADYMTTPFWLDGRTVPTVMLALERDWKIFYPAYNNLNDLDGDGAIDIGFNPALTYVGYFDSDSCYNYNTTAGLFERVGPTTPQSAAQAADLVPQSIKAQGRDIYKYNDDGERVAGADGLNDTGIRAVASAHGVCDRKKSVNGPGRGQWHGNWLNFALTSRMDALRKVLYGGKRWKDTATETVLELTSYLPPNGHTWGGELVADDLWADYARSSPWYDIPSFTGYPAPDEGKMHFWCRSSLYVHGGVPTEYPTAGRNDKTEFVSKQMTATRTYGAAPLFQVAANIPASNFHPIYATPLRIWDWVGDHGSGTLPNDWNLVAGKDPAVARSFITTAYDGKNSNEAARRFHARVKVCQKSNVGAGEGCKAYGENYKPVGLLQEYGESGKMFFGLLTGTLDNTTRWEGGVVRHHIQPFDQYVKPGDGTIVRPGLIDTIDRFQVTGIGYFYKSGSLNHFVYSDGTQAGNPLGEMAYEAVRYLSRRGDKYLKPTGAYIPGSAEVNLPLHNYVVGATGTALPFLTDWGTYVFPDENVPAQVAASRPGLIDAGTKCPKPIILILSEIFPDHDRNAAFPGESDFIDTPLMPDYQGTSDPATFRVPETFGIKAYLDIITDEEGYRTTAAGEQFFYPNQGQINGVGPTGRGVCEPNPLDGASGRATGLYDINGHCPSEPSLEGSYSLAAIAYYAHTHDIFHVGGAASLSPPTNVDTYAVGMDGNFPNITFTVDPQRSITIMPITVASDVESVKLRTLINFYVDSWEVDINKLPYKVKFATNFEFNTTPAWDPSSQSKNMERDIFNRFEITLLTTSATPKEYRERVPIYINSGRFRTDENKWKIDKANGTFPDDGNKKYYYAFRDPSYSTAIGETDLAPLDISQYMKNIVGVAIHNSTLGSFISQRGHGGYTISGVTRPGAYIEAGYHGDDNAWYSDIRCHGKVPIVLTGDYSSLAAPDGVPAADWVSCNDKVMDPNDPYYPKNYCPDRRGLPPGHRNPDFEDDLATPWECPFAGYNYSNRNDPDVIDGYGLNYGGADTKHHEEVCGKKAVKNKLMRYVQVRSFEFDTNAATIIKLKNPLWLAAKYGGFKDDGTIEGQKQGLPDQDSEWKRGGDGPDKDDPVNYFGVANMSELPDQLGKAFELIANSSGTGTANASSINTILGGGLSIQTQYHSDYTDPKADTVKRKWGGSVYAFFIDRWGNLRADTNGNQQLELVTSPAIDTKSPTDPSKYMWQERPDRYPDNIWKEIGDLIIHTVPVEGLSMPYVYLCRDVYGDNNGNTALPSDSHPNYPDPETGYPANSACVSANSYVGRAEADKKIEVGFEELGTVWNFAERLEAMGPDARRIYTYYGAKKADGSNNWQDSLGQFGHDLGDYHFATAGSGNPLPELHKLMGQATEAVTGDLIEYIRGHEFPQYRGRTVTPPWDPTGPARTWILGDVINSKPIIVGDAAANYNLEYGSRSYAEFKSSSGIYSYDTINPLAKGGGASKRRQVAYFGSNSGMLHAVNLGFFGALANGQAGYEPKPKTGVPTVHSDYKNLVPGDELWAYVPTAALPHLGWLADPAYSHGFYVDLKPYITDITDADGRWKTMLVMGLRFGGRTIEVVNADTRPDYSYSEFFALDVTEPDAGPPKLLWRFSHPYLGLSTATPTIVRSYIDSKDDWYVVLPSGPTSDVDSPDGSRRIPAAKYATAAYDGRSTQNARVFIINARTGQLMREPAEGGQHPLVASEPFSFFNDTFTPRAVYIVPASGGEMWSHHVIYMGLTATATDAGGNQIDTGAMYRLQMADTNGSPLPVSQWQLGRMYKTDKPITGAANAAYDRLNNLWVVFGTGRTWSSNDLAPCGMNPATIDQDCCENHDQYLFGLKEPLTDKGYLTFEEITDDSEIVDVSGVEVFDNGSISPSPAGLSVTSYDGLYRAMISKTAPKRGYKRKLESWRLLGESEATRNWAKFEVITTQPKIDGLANGRSNTVVTTYETSADVCEPAGRSFLWVVDTYTGLPAPYMASYSGFEGGRTKTEGGLTSQITGLKKSGAGVASEAWITKSGGQTIYGNTSFNSTRNKVYLPADQSESNSLVSWREVLDMGFDLKEAVEGLFKDLKD